tara:strand:+ start:1271 stop:1933 length:663 start_codon:yes stop_codon:yes gene_type:complete
MGKILLTVFIAFLISFGSLFFVPINFFVTNFLKNSDFNIEYSYLEGNIFSGKILDLYFDNNFIGDFNYENHFSLDNVTVNFNSIDDNDIQGTVIKQFSDITDIGSLKLKDFSASSIFSTDLIEYVDLNLDIKELEIVNFECENIIGNLRVSSQEINEELLGKLACFEGNTITAELFNKRMKDLGNVTYSNAQIKVRISTKTIPDKRVQLLMDYISFTIDL